MWIMVPSVGFLSIVAHRDDDRMLLVRGRVKEDVDRFATKVHESICVEVDIDADYPYRFVAKKGDVASAIHTLVLTAITYDNFKNEVARVGRSRKGKNVEDVEYRRLRAYHEIWSSLYGIAPRPKAAKP